MPIFISLDQFVDERAERYAERLNLETEVVLSSQFIHTCISDWAQLPEVQEMLSQSQSAAPSPNEYDKKYDDCRNHFWRRANFYFDLNSSGTQFRNPFLEDRARPIPDDDRALRTSPSKGESLQKRQSDEVVDQSPAGTKRFKSEFKAYIEVTATAANGDILVQETVVRKMVKEKTAG